MSCCFMAWMYSFWTGVFGPMVFPLKEKPISSFSSFFSRAFTLPLENTPCNSCLVTACPKRIAPKTRSIAGRAFLHLIPGYYQLLAGLYPVRSLEFILVSLINFYPLFMGSINLRPGRYLLQSISVFDYIGAGKTGFRAQRRKRGFNFLHIHDRRPGFWFETLLEGFAFHVRTHRFRRVDGIFSQRLRRLFKMFNF